MKPSLGILAHRGLWNEHKEMNSLKALTAAVEHGFGLEFDIRDYRGELIVSHDPPVKKTFSLESLLEKIAAAVRSGNLTLAVNVKCDGIEKKLLQLISQFKLQQNYFVFDMSVPTMIQFFKWGGSGARIASRLSEYEPQPPLLSRSRYLWVDCFQRDWDADGVWTTAGVDSKKVVFVSPELHHREPRRAWRQLKAVRRPFLLCTDYPAQARRYFGASHETN